MGGELGADGDEAADVALFDAAARPPDVLSTQPQWIADALSTGDRPPGR